MEPEANEPAATPRLASASLFCERCGTVTEHRIFHLRGGAPTPSGGFGGVARCRECRWTHPFEAHPEPTARIDVIVSDGERSARQPFDLPRASPLKVGELVPDFPERVVVRRIDLRAGRPTNGSRAAEVATVWATRESGTVVRISVQDGARTVPARIVVGPEKEFEVGGEFRLEHERLLVVALRARGYTWRRPGDRFRAAEVQRIYGRRTDSPPAGRSDWRSGRAIPSSRTSSTSRSDRSRSSPGFRRKRTAPRARTAGSGATVHRSSPR